MSKIAILTLGLSTNYGGILQASALYKFLESEGYEPVLLRKYPRSKKIISFVFNLLKIIPFQNFKGIRVNGIKYKQNTDFFNKYMPIQSPIMYEKSKIENYLNKSEISSIIVGSDQVWRYTYINDTEYDTYFLNFELGKKIKKISYAASFGINSWEAPNEKNNVTKYLSDFYAISVRESTGKEICKNEFNQENVELVLDPTLLVDRLFYLNMIEKNVAGCKNYDSINYILDKNKEKIALVESINAIYNHVDNFDLLTNRSVLTIPQWVASFQSTNFVITDSFHGMVFSIIFNKQFIVILNNNRGKDRFTSLCNLLGLQDRIIDSNTKNLPKFKSIDYVEVNKKLIELKVLSKKFLLEALG